MNVSEQIEGFEGRRYHAYTDTEGVWTNGVGHVGSDVYPNQVVGDSQINAWKAADIGRATRGVMSALPWAASLNEPRQAVLIGMAFQMGLAGMVGFHHMLSAAAVRDWVTAAAQMLDSKWAIQTPDRAKALAHQLITGEWNA